MLVGAVLGGAGPVAAASDGRDGFAEPPAGAAEALCARSADADPPASDQPTPLQRWSLAGCDGEALLYGIGQAADPVRARLCAFLERDEPDARGNGSGLFDGDGLLMTIYANGWGVRRNSAVATHLACESVDSAPAEREFRVSHVAGALHEPYYRAVFSPCDDITSGYAGGVCAAHDSRIAKAGQETAIEAYAARLPAPARPAFARLRKAQAGWSLARGGDEVDLTGSRRAADEIHEERLQDEDFVAMLTRLRRPEPPPPLSGPQFRQAQARIDAALPRLLARLATPAADEPGAVSADGIRKRRRRGRPTATPGAGSRPSPIPGGAHRARRPG